MFLHVSGLWLSNVILLASSMQQVETCSLLSELFLEWVILFAESIDLIEFYDCFAGIKVVYVKANSFCRFGGLGFALAFIAPPFISLHT